MAQLNHSAHFLPFKATHIATNQRCRELRCSHQESRNGLNHRHNASASETALGSRTLSPHPHGRRSGLALAHFLFFRSRSQATQKPIPHSSTTPPSQRSPHKNGWPTWSMPSSRFGCCSSHLKTSATASFSYSSQASSKPHLQSATSVRSHESLTIRPSINCCTTVANSAGPATAAFDSSATLEPHSRRIVHRS